jgi:hypothetical protein
LALQIASVFQFQIEDLHLKYPILGQNSKNKTSGRVEKGDYRFFKLDSKEPTQNPDFCIELRISLCALFYAPG